MRTAVILFNLGGPLDPEGVYPFLKSLFSDPAILTLPDPFRTWLARYIAWKRMPKAREIFRNLGDKSPLLENTRQQAQALKAYLGEGYKIFIAMRHAPPLIQEVVAEIKAYNPCEIILLPLYPQFSDTTTGSSLRQWEETTQSLNLKKITRTICCYSTLRGFSQANAELIQRELSHFRYPPRLLFSAHGLPEKLIKAGDPYVAHVAETAAAILKEMPQEINDWTICYQSRVGFLPWTKPDLESELRRAARDQKGVLIVPLSFVSEHSETLVELDITYKAFAEQIGFLEYRRVPAVSCHPLFIEGLAQLIQENHTVKQCNKIHKKCWQKGVCL